MCLQCTAKAEYVFNENAPKFLGDYSVMVATESNEVWKKDWDKGQVGFVIMNDPDFVVDCLKIFPEKLNMTYKEMQEDDEVFNMTLKYLDDFKTDVYSGYCIIKNAIDEGFDYNDDFFVWLVHRFHQFYPYIQDHIKELLTVKYEPEHPITGEKLKTQEI